MMRKFNIIFLITLLIFVNACEEDYIGQYPVDNVPPAPVSNVVVENFPGGSTIRYSLPQEDDLLCVTARYNTSTGVYKEMSSSAYLNSITLKGFGRSVKSSVTLVSIDKSYNESEPLIVEIEPEDSPIYDVLRSLNFVESFGGVKLTWDNPLMENIVFEVLVKNDEGSYSHIETVYSSEKEVDRAVRGMAAKPTEFAFYFRDVFDNYTDTIYSELTPMYEEELDKKKFVPLSLSSKFVLHPYGNSRMAFMWDNIYNVDNNLFYVNIAPEKIYFSFDMGVEAKLSRFRLWTRVNYMYQLHHLRTFEIWGTSDEAATKDPDNWDGWIKIIDCESIRPSGLTEGGEPTAEERQYLLEGEEWEIPLDAPKIRYIKFKINSTWSNSASAFINEITIWGTAD